MPAHNGLTDFGKEVVREMNRLGMVVDVSHVADKTFYDALEVTTKPVMCTHSSMRALSDVPRNVTNGIVVTLVMTVVWPEVEGRIKEPQLVDVNAPVKK